MQITPDDLLREAADMALELRIKDRHIAGLQAENERLREQVAGQQNADGQQGETDIAPAGHAHRH